MKFSHEVMYSTTPQEIEICISAATQLCVPIDRVQSMKNASCPGSCPVQHLSNTGGVLSKRHRMNGYGFALSWDAYVRRAPHFCRRSFV